MSELTTGTINIPATVIAAPISLASGCVNLLSVAAKYGVNKIQQLQREIEATEQRLKWIDRTDLVSPKAAAKAAREMHARILQMEQFNNVTSALSASTRFQVAAALVMEKSPLKGYVLAADVLKANEKTNFDRIFNIAADQMAIDRFAFVQQVLEQAAVNTGFIRKDKLKTNTKVTDVAFTDEQGRVLSAYARIDASGNSKLALDLHGFDCNSDACTSKMAEIVAYLHKHGIPFEYKRLKHNQPQGILRNLLQSKTNGNIEKKPKIKQNKNTLKN